MVEVPLFIVNGLIESGKTTLIKEIIENNVSYQAGTTLLIVLEDGEVAYSTEWLNHYGVNISYVESQGDLTKELLIELDKKYQPTQIVMEFNAFYDLDQMEFPEYMPLYQQVTLIDATSFKVSFNNMRQIFSNMIKYASLVIFNRCDGVSELGAYRRQIRAMNQNCQIGFEGSNGVLSTMLDEDLPYDLSKPSITLEDDDYPTWYVDVFDNPQKYSDKTIKFRTFVRDVVGNNFVVGRNVMTCCENDIQFLGYEVQNIPGVEVKVGDHIYLECKIMISYSEIALEDVLMLRAEKITKLKKEKDRVLTFN